MSKLKLATPSSTRPTSDPATPWMTPRPPTMSAIPTSPQPFNPTSLRTTPCQAGKMPTRKWGTGLMTGLLFVLGIGSGLVWMVSNGKLDLSTISPGGKVHFTPQKPAPQDGATAEKTRTAAMYNRAHSINWPIIELTGIASGMDKKSQSAILNGQLIRPHQTIQQVRLVAVTPAGVILEYRNRRKIIQAGEST